MSRRAFKRLGWGLLLTVLLVLGLVIAAAGYLTATPQGIRYLISQAERWLPGQIAVQEIGGSLWGELRITGFTYRAPEQQFDLESLYLDWEPAALLSGTLHIRTLALGPVSATLPPGAPPPEPEPESEPLTLPDLQLPLQVRLDELALEEVNLYRAATDAASATDPAAQLNRLHLRAHSEGDSLVVERLAVAAPQGHLELQGSLTPRDDFALQLQSEWQLQLPDGKSLSGQGPIEGTLARLTLSQQLSGLLNAQVAARLQLLEEKPAVRVEIKQIEADLGLAGPELEGRTLTGELILEGAGESVAVEGELRAPLPELGESTLTLQLVVSQAQLKILQLRLQPREGEARVQIKGEVDDWLQQPQLAIEGQWQELGYPLQEAPQWQSREGHFRLTGEPADYRLALDAALGGATLPRGQWQLKVQGSDTGLQSLTLRGKTLDGELSLGGALAWQPAPTWQLALQGRGINPGEHWPAWPGSLSFQAATEGRLDQEGFPQLTLELQSLKGELQGEPVEGRARGRLTGERTDYRIALDATLAGMGVPRGQWQLNAQGRDTGLQALSLQGKTLGGELSLEGALEWQPVLTWQLALEGQGLNPGEHWPAWPGSLSFQASSEGRLEDGAPELTLELQSLEGKLQGEPVEGQARGRLTGQTLNLSGLELAVAGAELTAEGELAETLDLKWRLQVPRFARLLPDAEGRLAAEGFLRGPREQPQLKATLEGENLRWQGRSITAVSGDIDLDLGGQQRSRIDLKARGLDVDGQRWQQLRLQGEGKPEQHRLEAALAEGPLVLELGLAGQWRAPQWQGTLQRLMLNNEQTGQWQLQAPVAVSASASEAQLERLCLAAVPAQGARLCARGRWSAEQGAQGQADVEGLPLRRLDPWLPPGTQTQGALWAEATFRQPARGRPQGQLAARVEDAQLWLPDEDLRLVAQTFTLAGRLEEQQLRADLELALEKPTGRMTAEVKVDDVYGQGRLKGGLQARLSSLDFVSLLVPQVQVLGGSLTSSLTLDGTYRQPRWGGALRLNEVRAELPALGTRLENIELVIQDREAAPGLGLEAGVRSGEGRLQLQGHLDPLAGTGEVSLTGERFLAMATEDIQAWISPDIQVVVGPELIKLRGELTVPEASIKPPRIETSVALSSDVVVVESTAPDETEPGEAGALERSLDARLRLTLGEQVEVEALGFEGRLEGSVVIVDDARRATRATGTLQVAAGEYRLYGQDLNISRGSLVFSGGPVDNPGLDLRVSREVDEVTVGARVGGSLRDPRLNLFSDPSMPESSILSYLLFGRPPGAGSSPSEQEMLRNAATALAIFGGNTLAENIQERFSVDELGLEGGDTAEQTSLYIGKYLSPRLYVKYGAGLLEPTNTFFMRYRLGEGWSLESQTGTEGSGGDLVYILER